MRPGSFLRWFDELRALLWPALCCDCGQLADMGAFCRRCSGTLQPLDPACPRCALPLARGGTACERCAGRQQVPFASAHATYVYGGAIANAIIGLKHGRRREVARVLAPLLLPALAAAAGMVSGALIAAPVPLHPKRLRQRGFNQALELLLGARAAALSEAGWGAELAGRVAVDRELLLRISDTPEMGHAGPGERRKRVAGAFALRCGRSVTGATIVLVDDVLTTGATAAECSRVLLGEGARQVHVVALARAVQD